MGKNVAVCEVYGKDGKVIPVYLSLPDGVGLSSQGAVFAVEFLSDRFVAEWLDPVTDQLDTLLHLAGRYASQGVNGILLWLAVGDSPVVVRGWSLIDGGVLSAMGHVPPATVRQSMELINKLFAPSILEVLN